MAKFHFTQKAIEDLDSIWTYTFENWSESQADTYYTGIITVCQHIADHPKFLDREYNEITQGLFCHHYQKHLIFYFIVEDGIEVVRILHEKMDIKSKF